MIIRNDQERKRCANQLAGWCAMRRRIVQMCINLQLDSSELADLCVKRSEELQHAIEEYEQARLRICPKANSIDYFEPLKNVEKIPEQITELRLALGWSQSDLAKACSVSDSQIHRWEKTGYARVKLSTATKLAKVLIEELQRTASNHKSEQRA